MNKSVVSIIVPVFCRADLTEVCIDSIIKYTKNFELIIVQEGEDPEITQLLKKYKQCLRNGSDIELFLGPKISIAHNKKPKGYSGALNTGLRMATGDYICFMNNDTVVTPGWMDKMLKAFDDKEMGLVTPTFWGTGDRQSVDWNDERVVIDYISSPWCIIGVCYLIPKKVMDVIGEWDEDFFHGGEDFDITIRIMNAGYAVAIAREAFIYHYGGASTRVLLGNDLETVRKHQVEKMRQVINKHNYNEDEVLQRL